MPYEPGRRVNGIDARLVGGPLDGDSFALIPEGSVAPPARLSYYFRSDFLDPDGEYRNRACWLHYECYDHVPEWSEEAVVYRFAGTERMIEKR